MFGVNLFQDETSLDLTGNLVSIDAMGCHQKIANKITQSGGEYLLFLKKNQGSIYQQVEGYMKPRKADLQQFSNLDYVEGRIEERTIYVSNSIEFIDNLVGWQAKNILMVESKRSYKNGLKPATQSRRFYLSSEIKDAEYFLTCTRNHWQIENGLPIAIHVSSANTSDNVGGFDLLWQLDKSKNDRLLIIRADGGYKEQFIQAAALHDWEVDVAKKPESAKGFVPQKQR